jgi:hypothetical protein
MAPGTACYSILEPEISVVDRQRFDAYMYPYPFHADPKPDPDPTLELGQVKN